MRCRLLRKYRTRVPVGIVISRETESKLKSILCAFVKLQHVGVPNVLVIVPPLPNYSCVQPYVLIILLLHAYLGYVGVLIQMQGNFRFLRSCRSFCCSLHLRRVARVRCCYVATHCIQAAAICSSDSYAGYHCSLVVLLVYESCVLT